MNEDLQNKIDCIVDMAATLDNVASDLRDAVTKVKSGEINEQEFDRLCADKIDGNINQFEDSHEMDIHGEPIKRKEGPVLN